MSNELNEALNKSFKFQNRELLDNYVSLVVTDVDGIIVHVSTSLCNLVKYKESEIIGKSYEFLIQKDSIGKFEEQFNDVKISKAEWKGEMKHASKSDETIWTDTIVRPLFDDDNNHVGFVFASHDISQEKKLKKIHEENMLQKKYDRTVLDFMPSFSSAVLLRTNNGFVKVLWIIFFTVIVLIAWASFSEIDELVRAEGRIIPSDKVQTISFFDGGVLEQMLVKEGDEVKKGQPIVKLEEVVRTSEFDRNEFTIYELSAKRARLEAERTGKPFLSDGVAKFEMPKLVSQERDTYNANQSKLAATLNAINEKISQKQSELAQSRKKIESLSENHSLMYQELKIKKELVQDGIISRVDYLQQLRQFNDIDSDLKNTKGSIPGIESAIKELKQNYEETVLDFKAKAELELTGVEAEIQRMYKIRRQLADMVERATIQAPVDGVVKEIFVKTPGAAVASSKPIMEIVPHSEFYVAELKVSPADIGFLYIGQHVQLKFRAYDFAIYGGLDGEISYISPDTIKDEQTGDSYYIVHVKSKRDYVGEQQRLVIKPGMTVDGGILTGKKTIMDYILKPILKAKQGALSEK